MMMAELVYFGVWGFCVPIGQVKVDLRLDHARMIRDKEQQPQQGTAEPLLGSTRGQVFIKYSIISGKRKEEYERLKS